ncbi:hypothetical protein [Streptosporangium sp. NPDC002721]|uniref:rhamnogalacturonan lyase family protein n=1 Tax=Streptosporangium sp. NPDC002721 TaxID=3366188 RepID=UPI00368F9B8C
MTGNRRGGTRRLRALALCAPTGLTVGVATVPAVSAPVPAQAQAAGHSAGPRLMERLDRGVVAVRSGEKEVLVSWRLLGLDPKSVGFDVERSTDGGPYRKLNRDVLTKGTNYVDVGHNDGVTVYDLDGDGRAEVAVRVADGVTFGDGTQHTETDDVRQSIAILDGRTGAPRATAPVPDDYLADGPVYARFGVGHLDGRTPSLVAYMKNRVGNGGFNLMYSAWRFDGHSLNRQWKFLRGGQDLPDGHNTRIVDVDGDGRDEVGEIGFLLNGDGTLRYSLAPRGIIHGDRWFIADIDPAPAEHRVRRPAPWRVTPTDQPGPTRSRRVPALA